MAKKAITTKKTTAKKAPANKAAAKKPVAKKAPAVKEKEEVKEETLAVKQTKEGRTPFKVKFGAPLDITIRGEKRSFHLHRTVGKVATFIEPGTQNIIYLEIHSI